MSGWVLSWIIGTVVVVIVVGVLAMMIRGASQAAAKAEDILAALRDARTNTAALWKVADTNAAAGRIVAAAGAARQALTGEDA